MPATRRMRGLRRRRGRAIWAASTCWSTTPASPGPTALVEHVTPAELDATLRIDLASMFHCSRRAIPALRANGGGAIINLSSAAGRFGFPLRAPYSAAKWGVIGFTKIAVDRTRPGRHPGQRDPARPGGRAAHPCGDQGEGRGRKVSENEMTERTVATTSLKMLRHAAGHRQHGALSRQPVRRDDQRPGDQRRCRHAKHGVTCAPRYFMQPGQPLSIEDRQTPVARPGDIVLQVAYCGICGSDLHATEPGPTSLETGTVLGHEYSGVVTEFGLRCISGRRSGDRPAVAGV